MIRKDNGSNNSLFLSCQMGLSDGAFFMIKHTPLPNENHPILSPICQMGIADTLGRCAVKFIFFFFNKIITVKKNFFYPNFLYYPDFHKGLQIMLSFAQIPMQTTLVNNFLHFLTDPV